MGMAYLNGINGTMVTIAMNPLGIEGELAFMSSTIPGPFTLQNGEKIFVYRALMHTKDEVKSASLMLGQEGDTVLSTA